MSRTLSQIEQELIVAKEGNENLSGLTSNSNVSIWRNWIKVFAFCQWIQEGLWDAFRSDVEKRIADTRVHTREWYRQIALYFQLGFALEWIDNKFQYTEIDQEAQIIKHAAVQKYLINGYGALRVKVAKEDAGGVRVPLSSEEKIAFQDYMNDVTDAGTMIIATSGPADDLKMEITISYDPQVLTSEGKRIDGTNDTPVLNAIKDYLKSQKFNGTLILQKLQNALEEVEGVTIPHTTNFKAWSRYGTHPYNVTGNPNAGLINEIRQADAGYFELDEDNTLINYITANE